MSRRGETKYVAMSDSYCFILGPAILIISCVVKVSGALSGHRPRNWSFCVSVYLRNRRTIGVMFLTL